jgi:hypothetical protein
MIVTDFEPASHGFHFSNGSFRFHVGPSRWRILCGGMVYAALDYFYKQLEVPDLTRAPAEGNPLEQYLFNRQGTAHFYTWHKFLGSLGSFDTGRYDPFPEDDFGELQQCLLKRCPVPLFLHGWAHAHHVLAIGCDRKSMSIFLYDPNDPDEKRALSFEEGKWKMPASKKVGEQTWHGWSIDGGYYSEDWPQFPPLSWRYCRQCHCLHTLSFGNIGTCSVGGKHDDNMAFEYFLPIDLREGDRNWWVCDKCQALFFGGSGSYETWCPVGGTHVPKSRSDKLVGHRRLEFSVQKTGLGEGNWRKCKNCTNLFWAGSGLGKCTVGGSHDADDSTNYILDYRTV